MRVAEAVATQRLALEHVLVEASDHVACPGRHRAGLPGACAEAAAAASVRHHADEPERGSRLDDHAQCGRARHGQPLPQALDTLAAMAEFGTMRVKSGLAEMLKGGVIMDVV